MPKKEYCRAKHLQKQCNMIYIQCKNKKDIALNCMGLRKKSDKEGITQKDYKEQGTKQ